MAASNKICYFVSGEVASGTTPCFPTLENSPCCPQGCLANGLCYNPATNATVRGTCTDQNWKSPYCPSYCRINEYQGQNAKNFGANRYPRVWPCSKNSTMEGGLMCCDVYDPNRMWKEKSCCPEFEAINLFSIGSELVSPAIIPSLSSTYSSFQSQHIPSLLGLRSTPTLIYATTSIPSSPDSLSRNSSGRSKSATVGIAVGATAATISLIIVIIGAFCLYQRRRRKSQPAFQINQFEQSQTVPVLDGGASISPPQELSGFQAFELSIHSRMDLPIELSTELRAELPTGLRAELPTDRSRK